MNNQTQVFFSFDPIIGREVDTLARRLIEEIDINLWLAPWHLVPGQPAQEQIENALTKSTVCIVCLGRNAPSGWHNEEMRMSLIRRIEDKDANFRIIPIFFGHHDHTVSKHMPYVIRRYFQEGLEIVFSTPDDDIAFKQLLAGILGLAPIDVDRHLSARQNMLEKNGAIVPVQPQVYLQDDRVWLCAANTDNEYIRTSLSQELEKRGLSTWKPRSGVLYGESLTQDMPHIRAVAVCIGANKPAWHSPEKKIHLEWFAIQKSVLMCLIILPDCDDVPSFPESIIAFDLRRDFTDGINKLAAYLSGDDFLNDELPSLGKNVEKPHLFRIIREHFNLTELKQLSFYLNINYEKSEHQIHSTFALNLIEACAHKGQLTELTRICFWLRPNAPW